MDERNENSEVHVRSPGPGLRRRNSELVRYLTSSGVRRTKTKDTHCNFCVREEHGAGFVRHLTRSRSCALLYMRILKVHSLENVLLKLFSCEICGETRSINFVKHLERNDRCLAEYRQKYGLDNCSDIAKKNRNLKRKLYKSRNAAARKLEYNNKKIDKIQTKTVFSSINDFRMNTMFFNYKLCVLCHSNFGGFYARELKSSEDLYTEIGLNSEDYLKLRRFEKSFICSKCEKHGFNKNDEELQGSVQLGEIIVEEGTKIILFPSEQATEKKIIEQEKVVIMIPSTEEATRIWPETELNKMNPNHDEVRKIYRSQNISNSQLKAIYDTEMAKFRKKDDNIKCAIIRNNTTKTLADVIKFSSDSRITGSNTWFSLRKKEVTSRIEQYGHLFLTLEIDLPDSGNNVIATALINEGVVVTADQMGCADGTVVIKYMVHPHDNSVDCRCNAEDLTDLVVYLETAPFNISSLYKKHVGTIVSAAHQIFDSFIKDIIGAPGSYLFSENFYFVLCFKETGHASIVGCFWPQELSAVNMDIASNSGELNEKAALLDFVENTLCALSDARTLKSTLKLSEREAENLSSKVLKHQHDLGFEPELPSLQTDIKVNCSSNQNAKAAREIRQYMKQKLNSLTDQDRTSLSTVDWLDGVFENVTGEIEDDEVYLKVTIDNEEEHKFKIDERMVILLDKFHENPLYAVYQYSLTCSEKTDNSMVIYKRLSVKDCFTKVYNPLILEACEASLSISLGNNPDHFENILSSSKQIGVGEGITRTDLLFTHRLVNVAEALSLADKSKKRIKTSSPSQFVNVKPNRPVLVKKAVVQSPNSYKLDGSNDYYDIVPDYISRHFNSKNGNHLLVETCLWYKYIGAEESKKVFELYDGRLDIIPDSEVNSVLGGALPKFLLCNNGDVLQIRKRAQVLLLPKLKSENDLMYQKCILFSAIQHEEELQQANLREKYFLTDADQNEKVVTLNERKIFKFKIFPEEENVSDEDGSSHGEDGTETQEDNAATQEDDAEPQEYEAQTQEDNAEEEEEENFGRNEFLLDQLLELL